ncbi:MAG: hypothetical protein LBH00_03115 [Planctomycetaceae bacterium]|jgi:hypothetical protein|nr:hypothetical protein [Planctomycetaceae bacterium]
MFISRCRLFFVLFFGFALLTVSSQGQESAADSPAMPRVAPGGLFVIPPDINYESMQEIKDIPELLAKLPEADPQFQGDIRFGNDWATKIRFAREIWCLEFSFKPMRIVEVDLPNLHGTLDKKKVWYLVYNVKNKGPAMKNPAAAEESAAISATISVTNSSIASAAPQQKELTLPVAEDKIPVKEGEKPQQRSAPLPIRGIPGRFEPVPGQAKPIAFVPQFMFAIHKLVAETKLSNDPQTGAVRQETTTATVSYHDQIIPLAVPVIMEREGMKTPPETSVSIAAKEIAPGRDLWGVAMWTDIDPRVHEFSVYVSGLTNAYQWKEKTIKNGKKDKDGNETPAYENTGKIGEGRILKRKVLKTDWWRLGDQFSLNDSQIRYGTKDGLMPVSIFDSSGDFNRDGRVDEEERKRYVEEVYKADTNNDGHLSEQEKAEYNRIHQIWLKPTYGYEWLYL